MGHAEQVPPQPSDCPPHSVTLSPPDSAAQLGAHAAQTPDLQAWPTGHVVHVPPHPFACPPHSVALSPPAMTVQLSVHPAHAPDTQALPPQSASLQQ